MGTSKAAEWALLGMVALIVSGCGLKLDGLIKDRSQPLPAADMAPATKTPVADTVEAIGLRIMSKRSRNYSSETRSYSYFIGGVLEGRYIPDSGILIITSGDDRPEPLVCKYSPQDNLYVPETGGAADVKTQECKALRDRLRAALIE